MAGKARKTAARKAQPVGPIGKKAVAEAERRAAAAKTPTAKKVTRELADRLRDVHSGNAGKRAARQSAVPRAGQARRTPRAK